MAILSPDLINNLHSLLDRFSEKKKILVFGETGVGKSQFIRSFDEKLKGIAITHRTEIATSLRTKIENFTIDFFDLAGDKQYNRERIDELTKSFSNKTYIGIINVVAFGYHENPNVREPVKLKEIFDGEEVSGHYLAVKKIAELNQLHEWVKLLPSSKVDFVLTVINKADVWWHQQAEVMDFYKTGKYHETFEEAKMPQTHYFLPYCSIFEPFYQVRNSGMYGTTLQQTHSENLIDNLSRLISKSSKK